MTGFNLIDIERMNAIDESPVPFIVRIKVRAEAAIQKNINDVSKRDEEIKMKSMDQKRQDVLRPDSFESLFGAVPIVVLALEAL